MSPHPKVRRAWRWVLLAVVVLGLGLRGVAYFNGRPLDGDELSLYLNLQKFDGVRLVSGRLDATAMSQAAPPLFLLAEDALARPRPMTLAGERLLRLPALICGLLTVPLAVWLAALAAPREVRRTAALVAGLAVALSARLLDVTQRAKQYAGDGLAAVLLTALLLALRRRGGRLSTPLWRHLTLGLAAAAAVWFSHPAVFVYAALAAGDVLLDANPRPGWRAWIGGAWRRSLASLPGGLIAVASTAAMYGFSAARQRDKFLDGYWTGRAETVHHWWRWPVQLLDTAQDLHRYALPPLGAAWAVLGVAGLVVLCRAKDRVAAAALAGPLLVTAAAATWGWYPFEGQRVCLFLLPSLLILAAVGAVGLMRVPNRVVRWVTAGTVAVPLAFAAVGASRDAFVPAPEPREAAAALADLYRPGDAIIAFERVAADHLAVYEPSLPARYFWYRDLRPPLAAKRYPPATAAGRTWLLVGRKAGTNRLLTPEAMALLPAGWSSQAAVTTAGGAVLLLTPPAGEQSEAGEAEGR